MLITPHWMPYWCILLAMEQCNCCRVDVFYTVGLWEYDSNAWCKLLDSNMLLVVFAFWPNNIVWAFLGSGWWVQVRMASVRRSLFTSEAERFKFLNRLVNGTREVLRTKQGLAEHDNYHEFCRLLGRLKTNYQLSELVGWGCCPMQWHLRTTCCVASCISKHFRAEASVWGRWIWTCILWPFWR